MKRSELHAKVWSTPMIRLGVELGVSDVGIAKACVRHNIPRPGRGYWAKLAAGHKLRKVSLPDPHDDTSISFDQAGVGRGIPKPARPSPDMLARSITVAATLERPHRLITIAQRYFEKVVASIARAEARARQPRPKLPIVFEWGERTDCGRYSSGRTGGFHIVATLGRIDWALRYSDSLLKALIADGWRVFDPDGGQGTPVSKGGQTFELGLLEAYDKVPARDQSSWRETEYRPAQAFTVRLMCLHINDQRWKGPPTYLESILPKIVAEMALLPERSANREAMEEAERKQRQEEFERAEVRRRAIYDAELRVRKMKEARSTLLAQALSWAEEYARREKLQTFLDLAEQGLSGREVLSPALSAWLATVREQAAKADPLAALEKALTGAILSAEKPLWWPESPDRPESNV